MLTLERPTSLEEIIKKSRFVATAGPIASDRELRSSSPRTRIRDANHNCWAWRVGQSYRCSDDGEPGGTAGKPILQAIDRLSLDNVAVVVTRWFGGFCSAAAVSSEPTAGPQPPACVQASWSRSWRFAKPPSP